MSWSDIQSSATDIYNNTIKGDLGLISDAYDKYVVSPLNAFGLGGFVFDVEGDTEVQINSEITDNYVEDNSARQDNIAVRPIEIRLKRYVGELTFEENPNKFLNVLNKVVQTLTIVDGVLPTVTEMTKQIKESIISGEIPSLESLTNISGNLWELVQNLNPANTKQAKAYLYLKALQTRRILVGVQTPFEFLPNMAIKTLIMIQKEESKFISDIEITLKQIRMASTEFYTETTDSQGRNAAQSEPEKNSGEVKGQEAPSGTISDYILGKLGYE